jgi:uncharacterized membrane protein
MKLRKEDLAWAAREGLISAEQADRLWQRLQDRGNNSATSKFDVANIAYYFGALIVMSAMGWLMTLGWERFGGLGIAALAACYALLFIFVGRSLWYKEKLLIPGGLLFTLAVWMTPLVVYGLERAAGVWPQGAPENFQGFHIWIKGSWILMEIGTVIAGLVALRFIRFPFLTFPVAFSLWYMSMDLTPLLVGKSDFSWSERLWVSLCFGLLILLATYAVDRKTREDYAFWGYLFGLMAFWGGMSLMESTSEWRRFLYCLINLGLIALSVFLQRRAFIVFGACGVFGYLSYLSYDVFKDSFLFPIVLSFLGLVVIYLGIQYQRHRDQLEQTLLDMIPTNLRRLRPIER